MKRILSLVAVSAVCAVPAFAQPADYCHPSGYVTGVASARDNPDQGKACDPRQVPRVEGVPQGAPANGARRNYNETQPNGANAWGQRNDRSWDQRYGQGYDQRYDSRYDRRHDPRYDQRSMGNNPERWRDGRYYYGARGPEWQRGHRIPNEYMARQYWVQDWRAHRLAAPPRGYQWVQVGSDYVLVALATGIIAQLLLAQ